MFVRYLPLLLSLSATAALAAPGGTLEYKITSARANGTVKVAVANKNVRSDMDMNAPGVGPIQMSVLIKNEQGYMLNAKDKTYAEIDIGGAKAKAGAPADDRKYTVKKLGNEKVGKWNAVHVLVTTDKGDQSEMWTTKDIDVGRAIFDVLGQRRGDNAGLMKALDAAGAGGLPVKLVTNEKGGATMELINFSGTAPAAALFEIPADWKKSDTAAMGALPPEARKKMEEAMKNMTPEQRKAMEEALKGKAAGGQ